MVELPSFGGAPTYDDECADDLAHHMPLAEPNCPVEIPSDGESCDIAENTLCVWQLGAFEPELGGGFVVSGCYATLSGTRWRGYGYGHMDPVGVNAGNCPHSLPAGNSTCNGHAGEYCYYPGGDCSCAGDGSGAIGTVIPVVPPGLK